MADDQIKGMARAICAVTQGEEAVSDADMAAWSGEARAAWAYALAALSREERGNWLWRDAGRIARQFARKHGLRAPDDE